MRRGIMLLLWLPDVKRQHGIDVESVKLSKLRNGVFG